MVSPLARVLVRTPTTTGKFVEDGHWRMPDTNALVAEHERFTRLLESLGCQVDIASPVEGLVDAVYMHDPMIMTPHGAILLNMAKPSMSMNNNNRMSEIKQKRSAMLLKSLFLPTYKSLL